MSNSEELKRQRLLTLHIHCPPCNIAEDELPLWEDLMKKLIAGEHNGIPWPDNPIRKTHPYILLREKRNRKG